VTFYQLAVSVQSKEQPISNRAFPASAVKIVVPVAAGGVSGQVAEILAKSLSAQWKTNVSVEHWVGDSGNQGVASMAKMPNDGNWILLTAPHVLINPLVNPQAGYNMLRDFEPVTNVITSPHAIAVNSSIPVKNLAELVALVKASPGKYSYSSAGPGSLSNFTCQLLQTAAHLDFRHITYDGGGPAVKAVVDKQADITCSPLSLMLAGQKNGKIRLLAVTSYLRSIAAPDVPTALESGYESIIVDQMQGLFVPAGTSSEVVGRILSAVRVAIRAEETRQAMEKAGHLVVANSPFEFSWYVKVESSRWRQFLQAQNTAARPAAADPLKKAVQMAK
jgi:tripartite-type tricarboxylate transporter receptor subunit TctC